MNVIDLFKCCRLYSAEFSSAELMDKGQPALYAFFDRLKFGVATLDDDIGNFKTQHGRSVQLRDQDWPFNLNLSFRGNPERFKGEGRRLVKQLSAQDASRVAQSLEFLSFLNEPLYIGKTEDLRVRFQAHHDAGFLYKMKDEHKRPPSDFVMFAFLCQEQDTRVLESILLQVINPILAKQKS